MNTIDAMKQAVHALESHGGNYKLTHAECVVHGAVIAGLSAAIAREEAQTAEPVAIVESWTNSSYSRNYKVNWLKNVPEGTKLFTHPTPPPSGARAALPLQVAHAANNLLHEEVAGLKKQIEDMLAADAQLSDQLDKRRDQIGDLKVAHAKELREIWLKKHAQQVAVPQGFGEMIRIAAWFLSPEPLRLLGELLENKHISRSQFSKVLMETNEAYRLKAIEIKRIADKLAASPQPPQAERVPMTDAVIDACMQDVAAAALAGIGLPHDKVDAQAPLVVKFAKENLQSYFAVLAARGKS